MYVCIVMDYYKKGDLNLTMQSMNAKGEMLEADVSGRRGRELLGGGGGRREGGREDVAAKRQTEEEGVGKEEGLKAVG